MKRTGFARPTLPPRADRSAEFAGFVPRPRSAACPITVNAAGMVTPIPKGNARRSPAYLRWVATLACAHCGRAGPSQAAHADEGKGMSIKAPDDTAMPLCADAPGRRGCHSLIGTDGMFNRVTRRALEQTYGARTRDTARETGHWPPEWA